MSTEGKEIKKIEEESPFLKILTAAINREGGMQAVETIAKLYREERDDARRIAFNIAMAQAQGEMKRIIPNATNQVTRSQYATYDRLNEAVRPIYSNHGFSLLFNSKKSDVVDKVEMTCLVTHDFGWSQEFYILIPADGKGARGNDVQTKTHATGSAISYGMRYLLKMIFNLAIGFDDDDDGNAAGKRERQKPPTRTDPPQGNEIEKMKTEILNYCLAESDGDPDRAQKKLYEITTGWKNVGGKREKHFEGVIDVNDPDFNERRVQYVHSQLFKGAK